MSEKGFYGSSHREDIPHTPSVSANYLLPRCHKDLTPYTKVFTLKQDAKLGSSHI